MAASHAAMTCGGVPFGPGQAAELPDRQVDALLLDRRHVGKLREPRVADHGEQPKLAGVELRADLLQLADAHVERVVEHVDQHVAAAFEGGDDRR